MEKRFAALGGYLSVLFGLAVLLGLYLTAQYSYLLFHSLAEVFSIVVGCGIFMVAWNSRRFIDNNYFLFIGIAYLFVAGLDLLHTLAYKGMGVFQGYDANLPTQLWIASRYVESLSLLIAPMFLGRKLNARVVLVGYMVVVGLLLGAIYYGNLFPDCYIEGQGLTAFKKVSEYVISFILLLSALLLFRKRGAFDTSVLRLLILSIILTIGSELTFTFYFSVYGFLNLLGHLLKILSFYLIYKAIIETGFEKPYDLLFRNLKQNEQALRESEEKHRTLIEQSLQGLVVTQGVPPRFVFVNPAMAEIAGYSVEQLTSLSPQKVEALIHPGDRAVFFQRYRDRLAGKSPPPRYEVRIIRQDGSIRWVEMFASLIEYGGRPAVQSAFVDITERRRVEEELRKLSRAVEQSPSMVVITDTEGTIEYVNPRFSQVTGYRAEEVIGQDPSILKSGEQTPEFYKRLWDMVLAGDDWQGEFHNRKKSGELYWELAFISPIARADGSVTHLLKVAEDITDRKRAEQALERETEINAAIARLSSALLAPISFDEAAHLVLEHATRLTGSEFGYVGYIDPETGYLVSPTLSREIWDSCQVTDKNIVFKTFGGLWGWVLDHRKSLLTNTPADDPRSSGTPAGHIPIQRFLSAPAMVRDMLVGQVSVANAKDDYTERDLAVVERLAALYAIALQRHRGEEALRQRTVELQARNEELDAFAHTVAHDLKGPLALVVGFAEVLEDAYDTLPAGDLVGYLHHIARSGRKMETIIDELLLLASVRKAEIEAEPLDMAEIVAEARQRLDDMIDEHQAEIILPAAWPLGLGHPPWIEEVWVNYLSNAIRYGGRPPRIELGAEVQKDGMVRLWVRDNGRGLAPEEQERLFVPFTQLGQSRVEGYGLGLSIVRRIVERLGGRVGVESEGVPGQGSVFTFTLPGVSGEV